MQNQNAAVRELQRYLRIISGENIDVPVISVDGIYGSVTEDVVRAFQQSYGLPPTGVVDLATWTAAREESELITGRQSEALHIERFSPPSLMLRQGDSGDVVLLLQIMLEVIGGRYLNIDAPELTGIYDALTELAVTGFQRAVMLPASGMTDKATWNALADTYNTTLGETREKNAP